MKKLALVLAMAFLGTLAVQAANSLTPAAQAVDQVLYAKVINDTGAEFKYKAGNDVYTIDINESEPMAFEENTQIMKKDGQGNWVNWFVFNTSIANQSHQLSTLLNM